MKKFFLLSFVPTSVDFGLLVLRVLLGASMLWLHGWGKVKGFSSMFHRFSDPFGLGPEVSYVLAAGGEFFAAGLVVLGLFTRFAAFWTACVMGVAFFMVHDAALSGPRSGEMALLYLIGFASLVITGAGRYSFDARMGAGG